mmetsp:Transcript_158751/g.505424  ORF Transcript_158751/g.505424 Transcript_158751/m.505424 type:complete len:239 (+) Transcript_158751:78-794(+)
MNGKNMQLAWPHACLYTDRMSESCAHGPANMHIYIHAHKDLLDSKSHERIVCPRANNTRMYTTRAYMDEGTCPKATCLSAFHQRDHIGDSPACFCSSPHGLLCQLSLRHGFLFDVGPQLEYRVLVEALSHRCATCTARDAEDTRPHLHHKAAAHRAGSLATPRVSVVAASPTAPAKVVVAPLLGRMIVACGRRHIHPWRAVLVFANLTRPSSRLRPLVRARVPLVVGHQLVCSIAALT